MGRFYSPEGNFEVWDNKPDGYFTEEEWQEAHPPEPYIPTKEEKINALNMQYDQDKSTLVTQYTDALIHDDTDTADAIKEEMLALDAQYDADYQAILSKEE